MKLKFLVRPALKIAAAVLRALDSDKTGIDDTIADKLDELSEDPNVDDLLKDKNPTEDLDG